MRRLLLLAALALAGCGGQAWNTAVADHPQVREAMLASVVPGQTTEKRFVAQWGMPTQKINEGAQISYVYRNMTNPPGYYAPQFGTSAEFVVAMFQYGLAIGAFSSDTQGCRATFAPRPPGPNLDNPSTVHAVNCGVVYDGSTEHHPIREGIAWIVNGGRAGKGQSPVARPAPPAGVTDDSYGGGKLK
ncbi:hypothetical protein EF888_05190 [Silicimonas algicola]|uniref:Lipoprotein n=1 Tax=Silicimonas algicola TaxID=1826607 RepID=A0A316GHS7_9RHOB|nr:hypothetical protein [Silicimonas algicola]AZQ66587.1 hypothetical protein EF888_05190 [Silicimonas algicola]PWK58930.1 hypothetical protein C8D95_101750 [Silicimonas algicola]